MKLGHERKADDLSQGCVSGAFRKRASTDDFLLRWSPDYLSIILYWNWDKQTLFYLLGETFSIFVFVCVFCISGFIIDMFNTNFCCCSISPTLRRKCGWWWDDKKEKEKHVSLWTDTPVYLKVILNKVYFIYCIAWIRIRMTNVRFRKSSAGYTTVFYSMLLRLLSVTSQWK